MILVKEQITKDLQELKKIAEDNVKVITDRANADLAVVQSRFNALRTNTLRNVIAFEGLKKDVEWDFNDDFTGVAEVKKQKTPVLRKKKNLKDKVKEAVSKKEANA